MKEETIEGKICTVLLRIDRTGSGSIHTFRTNYRQETVAVSVGFVPNEIGARVFAEVFANTGNGELAAVSAGIR